MALEDPTTDIIQDPFGSFSGAMKEYQKSLELLNRRDVIICKTNETDLCTNCERLYADAIQTLKFEPSGNEVGFQVASLGHIRENADCPMCSFFYEMRWGNSDKGDYHLYAFSARRIFHNGDRPKPSRSLPEPADDAAFFGVVPDRRTPIRTVEAVKQSKAVGFIATSLNFPFFTSRTKKPDPRSFYGRVVRKHVIDYNLLRGWLSWCDTRCRRLKGRWDKSTPLYLINCTTREVVRASTKRMKTFVALSYVLGSIKREASPAIFPHKLPDRCPAVIEDAITVTKELGFQYLWVDMFNIDPADDVRHSQVSRMDLVYKCAAFTIIAAAGEDAEYGLPGVGGTIRRRQPAIEIKNHTLVSTLPDPVETVKNSKYNTRGWTYQERFFSYHRLIFTDDQVYFECPVQNHYESISIPEPPGGDESDDEEYEFDDRYLKLSVDDEQSHISYNLDGTQYINGAVRKCKLPGLRMFEQHIQQYTSRDLTYDSDSLTAIKSILDRWPNDSHPIEHLWGVPFQPNQLVVYEFKVGSETREARFTFAYGLCWTHGNSPDGLSPRRRLDFPSWSWTGWAGAVSWIPHTTIDNDTWYPFDDDKDTKFEYENGKGHLIPVGKWRGHCKDTPPTRLFVTANALIVQFKLLRPTPSNVSEPPAPGYYLKTNDPNHTFLARLHLTWSYTALRDINPNTSTKMWDGSWIGIVLGRAYDVKVVYILIVGRLRPADKCLERIGIIQVPQRWYLEQKEKKVQFWLG